MSVEQLIHHRWRDVGGLIGSCTELFTITSIDTYIYYGIFAQNAERGGIMLTCMYAPAGGQGDSIQSN